MKYLTMILAVTISMMVASTAANAARFTASGNGTVSDSVTSLIWQQQDDNTTRTWLAALAYCEALSLGGQTDWRLPNVKELRSIVKDTTFSPAIDTTVFLSTNGSYYWSSSTHADPTNYAWLVYFSEGGGTSFSDKSGSNYVRCVR